MILACERCSQQRDCRYFGSPADVDEGEAQNGEWLCAYCVEAREHELDVAIATLRKVFGE